MIFHRYLPSRSIILPYVFHTMDGPERSWVRPGTPSTHMGRATGWCSQSAPWQTGWVGWCWMFFASPKTIEKKYPILKNKIKILFYNCGKLLFHLFGDYHTLRKKPLNQGFFHGRFASGPTAAISEKGRHLRWSAVLAKRGMDRVTGLGAWEGSSNMALKIIGNPQR